jgi:25S rRNA (uracil2634-N3)-methyltransferase
VVIARDFQTSNNLPTTPPNTLRLSAFLETMSKTKTKRSRRELKRDASRKIANLQKAAAKSSQKPPAPSTKKHKPKNDPKPPATAVSQLPVQASQKHEVPFGTYDHILLVGEGDFSFAKSLVTEHACANVTTTSFDSDEEVRAKYPRFAQIYDELSALTPPVPIHHTIDATKLGSYKALRSTEEREGGWDTIAFMFPHTGGLSTDVNRQVRAFGRLFRLVYVFAQGPAFPARRWEGAGLPV